MARWPALLLLAALAFASVQTGIAGCGYQQWQCGNGECIGARKRCDGLPNCSDSSDEEAAMCDKVACSCSTKGGSCQSSTYVPEDGSCFEVQSGATVYVKPKERVSEKLQCSSEAVQCELQRGSSKQYGTEWAEARGTENSTAKTKSDSLSVPVEGGFYDLTSVPESYEHVWSREMAEAMSHTVSTGWSNQTVGVSMPVCHIPPGRTGWVELKPEFYAKEAVVRYLNGTSASIVRLFPKTTADGSIAGVGRCVVEKTETAWRRRRRNLQGVNNSDYTPYAALY